MNNDLKLDEFYRTQYEHEANRRHQISGQISTPIAVFTVISGALYAMAQGITLPLDTWEFLSLGGLALALIAAAAFAFYLVKFQFGYAYHYVPSVAKLEQYRRKLEAFHDAEGSKEGVAKAEYNAFVQKELVECADANTLKNDAKSGYLYKTHSALAAYVGLAFLTSIPSIIGGVVQEPSSTNSPNIEVVTMADDRDPPDPSLPPPERTERPEPPERRIIKENEIPPRD